MFGRDFDISTLLVLLLLIGDDGLIGDDMMTLVLLLILLGDGFGRRSAGEHSTEQ